jgi:hypothetical protein
MRRWIEGLEEDKQITCIITYEEKVIQPRKTTVEYELNFSNPSSVSQLVLLTIETTENAFEEQKTSFNTLTPFSDSSSSTLIRQNSQYQLSSSNKSFFQPENVWKRRNLENSINLPPPENEIKSIDYNTSILN